MFYHLIDTEDEIAARSAVFDLILKALEAIS